MKWKILRLGKKFGVRLGVILLLLLVTVGWAIYGISQIVSNAGQVIDGNRLNGELAQKEVDHLYWVNKVGALLNGDKITKLEVETDDHKCAFGKWLYGDGRKQAEKLVPSLVPIFSKIEQPHKHLHDSAIEIGQYFQ